MATARGKGDTPHRHLGGCAPASLQLQLYCNFSLLLRLSTTTLYFSDDFTSKLQLRHQSPSLSTMHHQQKSPLSKSNGGTLPPHENHNFRPGLRLPSPWWAHCIVFQLQLQLLLSCNVTYFNCASTTTDFLLKLRLQSPFPVRRCPPPILQPPSPLFLLSLSQCYNTLLPLYILYIL